MPPTIAAWLADKTGGLIIFILACIGVIAIPVAIVQTVRLDGVSLFGWHMIDGALHERDLANQAQDAALKKLGACQANTGTLTAAINDQNAKIAALKAAGDKATADAAAQVAAAEKQRDSLQAKLRRIDQAPIDTSSAGAAALSIHRNILDGLQ